MLGSEFFNEENKDEGEEPEGSADETAWEKAEREERQRQAGPFGDKQVPWSVTDALVGIVLAWISLGIVALFASLDHRMFGRFSPVISSLTGYALFVLIVWGIAIKIRKGTLGDLGVKRFPFFSAVLQVLFWWVVVRGLTLVYVVTLEKLGIKPSVEQAERVIHLFGKDALGFVLAIVVAVILAPFVEELLFRGFVYPSFRQTFGVRWAIFANGIVFSLVHFDIFLFVPLAFIGFALAWLFERYDSLGPPILFHALNNLVSIVILYYLT